MSNHIKQTAANPNQLGHVVINPDGTALAGAGAGAGLTKVFSTDGTDAGAVYGKADADGILNVKLVATGGTNINISAGDIDVDLDYATDGVAIGNETAVADFNSGAAGAQTLRVVQATDSGILISTAVTNTFSTVGVASASALAANASRKTAVFVNDSANIIYLGLGGAAVVGSGIRLNSNGGSYEINSTNMYRGQIFAIATGAASNMTIIEGA